MDKWVFGCCKNLKEVNFPSTVKTIEENAFGACYRLKNVVIPDGCTTIGKEAFSDIDDLNITLPDSVTNIDDDAFEGGYRPTIHANPDSYAREFADAHGYTFSCIEHGETENMPAIPPTCMQEGYTEGTRCAACQTALSGCETIPKSGSKLTEPSASYTVTKSGSENGTVEYSKMRLAKNNAVVPDTVNIDGIEYKVTSIAKDAFKNNKNIKKVTIGSNISKISASAFSGCMSLKTITIKSGKIKSVGKNAFKGIRSDAKIKVPASKLKKYEKLFSGKGQKSTVKITK